MPHAASPQGHLSFRPKIGQGSHRLQASIIAAGASSSMRALLEISKI